MLLSTFLARSHWDGEGLGACSLLELFSNRAPGTSAPPASPSPQLGGISPSTNKRNRDPPRPLRELDGKAALRIPGGLAITCLQSAQASRQTSLGGSPDRGTLLLLTSQLGIVGGIALPLS